MDENPKHAVIPPGYRLGPAEDDPPDVEGPPQFGIRALLIVQAGFAVFLALLMATGMFAVLIAFVLTILLQWGGLRIRNVALRRVVFDLLAGIALPVLCIWYDPGFFANGGGILDYLPSLRVPIYLLVALEIVALLGWLVYDTLTRRPSGLFAGLLSVGCVAASAIGAVMLPITLMGMLFLIGILGLTPFLTAYVCGRNVRRALRLAPDDSCWLHGGLFVLGASLAAGVPLLLQATCGETLAAWIKQIPFPGFPF